MQNAFKIIRNTPRFIVLSQTSFYDYFYILHIKPRQYKFLIISFVCKQTVKRFIGKNAGKKRVHHHGNDCRRQIFFQSITGRNVICVRRSRVKTCLHRYNVSAPAVLSGTTYNGVLKLCVKRVSREQIGQKVLYLLPSAVRQ